MLGQQKKLGHEPYSHPYSWQPWHVIPEDWKQPVWMKTALKDMLNPTKKVVGIASHTRRVEQPVDNTYSCMDTRIQDETQLEKRSTGMQELQMNCAGMGKEWFEASGRVSVNGGQPLGGDHEYSAHCHEAQGLYSCIPNFRNTHFNFTLSKPTSIQKTLKARNNYAVINGITWLILPIFHTR